MRTMLVSFLFAGALVGQQCNLKGTFTTATRSNTYDNRNTKCAIFVLVAQNVGFSALSLELDGAPDNGAGAPGAWFAVASKPPGSNGPCTDLNTCLIIAPVAYPFMSVNLNSKMGTGTITWSLVGTNTIQNVGNTVVADSGGGGGGGGGSTTTFTMRQAGALSSTPITTTIPVVAGDYFFVGIASNTSFPTLSDGTNTYTLIIRNSNGSGQFTQLYFTKPAATAALTLVATGGSAVNLAYLDAIPPPLFTGTVDATASNTGGISGAITTTHANELIVSVVGPFHGNICLTNLAPMELAATAQSTDAIAISFSQLSMTGATIYGASLCQTGTVSDAVTVAGSLF